MILENERLIIADWRVFLDEVPKVDGFPGLRHARAISISSNAKSDDNLLHSVWNICPAERL